MLHYHFVYCMWNDSEGNHKYHLANRDSVSMSNEFGGLGVPNIRDLNICLLGSWLQSYQVDEGELWKDIIDFKYNTEHPNIFCARDSNSYQFFKEFMWAVQAAKMGFRWKIGNDRKIR